jgi:3-dehydroquinate synthase
VPPGEASKSLDLARRLYDELARQRVERRDIILTFGGGVVGDLGGFVAATWLRGIRFLQIPTTLEAAIDASVGGKTAINHPAGKNLIGAFHQPIGVVVDTDFLATLPQRDFVAGLGESVKHAAISPGDFLDWHEARVEDILARAPGALTELIARNCTIKAAIVSRDEREADLRAILNYGHTIGHALEHHFGYELRHGECVALGMLVANEINCQRGGLDRAVADRIAALIARLSLPTRLPRRVDPAEIARLCQADKKMQGGAVRFVLLAGLGSTVRAANVTDAEIEQALAAIQP